MTIDLIANLFKTIATFFLPTVPQNPLPLLLVAGFIGFNAVFFLFTRGKEFAVTGLTGALFMLPFLKM